jgi:predicted anti-sigma-YlaC factor YlaD
MMHVHPTHLSEEALDDVLIGLASAESEAHLATCEICRGRVEAFLTDVNAFNQASMAWSQARLSKRSGPSSVFKVRHALHAPLIWAMAATIIIAIGLPAGLYDHWSFLHRGVTSVSVSDDSPTQIAQDNDLMKSVNNVLSETEVSPYREYNLQSEPKLTQSSRQESRNR